MAVTTFLAINGWRPRAGPWRTGVAQLPAWSKIGADQVANPASDVLLNLPPRPLTQEETSLVAEWLSLAQDISLAYVSARRMDDPATYQRVVISDAPDNKPTHLVHAPSGLRLWVKLTVGQEGGAELFDSLAAALNSIRNVLK